MVSRTSGVFSSHRQWVGKSYGTASAGRSGGGDDHAPGSGQHAPGLTQHAGGVLALLPLPQPIRSRKLFFQGEHPGPAAVRAAPAAPAAVDDNIRGPASLKPALGPRKTDREREPRGDDRDRNAKAKVDDARRTGKLTLNDALAGEGGRTRSLAAMKRKQEKARQKALGIGKPEKQFHDVKLPESITPVAWALDDTLEFTDTGGAAATAKIQYWLWVAGLGYLPTDASPTFTDPA